MGLGNIQRRLLRLAINKLGVVDTDALELDTLDLSWGQTNTIKLKDIALLKHALTSLLQLPPTVQISHAKIAKLEITITINSISPTISVLVDGVDIRLKIVSSPESRTNDTNKTGGTGHIPFSEDLTASVIKEEITNHRDEIEEAFSKVPLQSDMEDGGGAELSLPFFLRRMIQNVLNKFQLSIINVNLSLDPGSLPETGFLSSIPQLDLSAILAFHMDKMEIEGLTSDGNSTAESRPSTATNARTVTFSNAVASILTNYKQLSPEVEDNTEIGGMEEGSSETSSVPFRNSPSTSQLSSNPERTTLDDEVPHIDDINQLMSQSTVFPIDMTQSMHHSQLTVRQEFTSDGQAPHSPTGSFYSTNETGSFSHLSLGDRQLSYGSLRSARSDVTGGMSQSVMEDFHDASSGNVTRLDSSPYLASGARRTPFPPTLDNSQLPFTGQRRYSSTTGRRPSISGESQYSATSGSPRDGVALTAPMAFDGPSHPSNFDTDNRDDDTGSDDNGSFNMRQSIHSAFTGQQGRTLVSQGRRGSSSDGDKDNHMTQSQLLSYSDDEQHVSTDTDNSLLQSQILTSDHPQSNRSRSPSSGPGEESVTVITQNIVIHTSSPSPPSSPPYNYNRPAMPGGLWESFHSDTNDANSPDLDHSFTPVLDNTDRAHEGVPQKVPEPDPYAGLVKREFFRITKIGISVPVPSLADETADLASDEMRDGESAANKVRSQKEEMITIGVDNVNGAMDVRVVQLLDLVLKRLSVALTTAAKQPPARPVSPTSPSNPDPVGHMPQVNLKVGSIGILFVNSMREELSKTLESIGAKSDPPEDSIDEILALRVTDIELGLSQAQNVNILELVIGNLGFKALDTNILSFDEKSTIDRVLSSTRSRRKARLDKKPTTSTRPAIEVSGSFGDTNRIKVVTAPVVLDGDISVLSNLLDQVIEACPPQTEADPEHNGVWDLKASTTSHGSTISTPTSISVHQPSVLAASTGNLHLTEDAPASLNSSPMIEISVAGVNVFVHNSSSSISLHTSELGLATRGGQLFARVDRAVLFTGDRYSASPVSVELKGLATDIMPLLKTSPKIINSVACLLTQSEGESLQLDEEKYGSVVNIHGTEINLNAKNVAEIVQTAMDLASSAQNLARVSKLLPQADGPGMILLGKFDRLHLDAQLTQNDPITLDLRDVQGVHLLAPGGKSGVSIGNVALQWRDNKLVKSAVEGSAAELSGFEDVDIPRFRAVIGDQLWAQTSNLCVEYNINHVLELTGIDWQQVTGVLGGTEESKSTNLIESAPDFACEVLFRNTVIGLNPRTLGGKVMVVLGQANLQYSKEESLNASLSIESGGLMVIDDATRIGRVSRYAKKPLHPPTNSIQFFVQQGFVHICDISGAFMKVKVIEANDADSQPIIEVDLEKMVFLIQACADSAQTLGEIMGQLGPEPAPVATPKDTKKRGKATKSSRNSAIPGPEATTLVSQPKPEKSSDVVSMFAQAREEMRLKAEAETLKKSNLRNEFMSDASIVTVPEEVDLLGNMQNPGRLDDDDYDAEMGSSGFEVGDSDSDNFDLDDDCSSSMMVVGAFSSAEQSAREELQIPEIPTRIHVRGLNVIINLFDGYDWPRTRAALGKMVTTRRTISDLYPDDSPGGELVSDPLADSFWFNIDEKLSTDAIRQQINNETNSEFGQNDDLSNEDDENDDISLARGRNHKLTVRLGPISADIGLHRPNHDDIMVEVNLRVYEAIIFDHVNTSGWKIFLQHNKSIGGDLNGLPMAAIRLEVLQPAHGEDPELSVLVKIEPLQLQVDQDTLAFLLRFLGFKKPGSVAPPPTNKPRFQQVQISAVQLELDYKAKRIDYNAVRSGKFSELVNASVLERANIMLRTVILYSVDGPDELHAILNKVWTDDVIKRQLPTLLSALAMLRPITDVAANLGNLVIIPLESYKKTGLIFPGLVQGMGAFATGGPASFLRLGAVFCGGLLTVIEGTGGLFSDSPLYRPRDEQGRVPSKYANQASTIQEGLRMAFREMARDWRTALNMVADMPAQIARDGTAVGAIGVLGRNAPGLLAGGPIMILKGTKTALLGASNHLNSAEAARLAAKYK